MKWDFIIYKKPKRKKRKKIKSSLQKYADKLNKNLPASEVWFQNLYKKHKDRKDKFNKPFGKYIPDVINNKYKYIIEIDGSIHSLPEQIMKDKRKDKYYNSFLYRVIRVKAFNLQSFNEAITTILSLRKDSF